LNPTAFFFGKSLILLSVITIVIQTLVLPYFSKTDFLLVGRVNSLYDQRAAGEKEDRDYQWESAWRQFKENPVLGDSYITDYDKSYAHNLILDSLMATGIVGTALLLYLIYKSFVLFNKSNKRFKIHFFPIWIMFLSILLLSMTSGGLFAAFPFWIMLAVTSKIPIYAHSKY
jgi:O-antigen ligase